MVGVVADALGRRAASRQQLPQARAEVRAAEHDVEDEPGQHEDDGKRVEHPQTSSIGIRERRRSTQPTAIASAR